MPSSKNNRTECGLFCLIKAFQNEANVSDHSFNMVEFDQFKNTGHYYFSIRTQIKPAGFGGFNKSNVIKSNQPHRIRHV